MTVAKRPRSYRFSRDEQLDVVRRMLTTDIKGDQLAREVGISRRTLTDWTRELRPVVEAEGVDLVGQVAKQQPQSGYSADFRLSVVKRYLEGGISQAALAREVGITQTLVWRWTAELRDSVLAEGAFAFFG